MATLHELVELLPELESSAGVSTKATSVRLPEPVHRAVTVASELGMDDSFTAATVGALVERVRSFARQEAIAAHLRAFPADQPRLADVARRRVSGTDHVAAEHPEMVDRVADWYERRHPDWASSGRVDAAVDEVIDRVEMLHEFSAAVTGAG